jgi:hypothetical protein
MTRISGDAMLIVCACALLLSGCGVPLTEAYVIILQEEPGGPVEYELAGRRTTDVEEVGRWLVEARREAGAAGLEVEARIYAPPNAPSSEVGKVAREIAQAGFESYRYFHGRPGERDQEKKGDE